MLGNVCNCINRIGADLSMMILYINTRHTLNRFWHRLSVITMHRACWMRTHAALVTQNNTEHEHHTARHCVDCAGALALRYGLSAECARLGS